MQCTLPIAGTATAPVRTAPHPLPITPTSVAVAFALVPDPRRQASVTSALPALRTLAIAAILCNQQSVLAVAEWGRRPPPAVLAQLGFPAGRAPCQSTVQGLFTKLDGHALAAALTAYFAPGGGAATGGHRAAEGRHRRQGPARPLALRTRRLPGPCADGLLP